MCEVLELVLTVKTGWDLFHLHTVWLPVGCVCVGGWSRGVGSGLSRLDYKRGLLI